MDLFDIRKEVSQHQRDDVDSYELVVNLKVRESGTVVMKQVSVYSGLSVEDAQDLIKLNVNPEKTSSSFTAMNPWFKSRIKTQSLDEYATSQVHDHMKSNGLTLCGMSEDLDVPYEQLDEMFFGACSWDLLTLAKIESYYGLKILTIKQHSK